MSPFPVYIGSDPREQKAFHVCMASLLRHSSIPLKINPLILSDLRDRGLYYRPTERRGLQLWDKISDSPMSTEFAISRFLVPALNDYKGWALFVDSDFMFRSDIAEITNLIDDKYAAMVVKHYYDQPIVPNATKMDNQRQTQYGRKNWSSFILWNCGHPANEALTIDCVNSARGLNLHQFLWLDDHQIGQIPFEWNWLDLKPKAVHFSWGTPDMDGYENAPFSDEWRSYL